MILVNNLIWDDWNRKHLAKHHITPEEVEEVCQGKHKSVQSYRIREKTIHRPFSRRQ